MHPAAQGCRTGKYSYILLPRRPERVKMKMSCSTGAPEYIKALADLNWCHDTSTPHRPQTNGVAERCVRRSKEGTSTTLQQSGFTDDWWQEAMMCYCFHRHVVDLLVVQDRPTPATAYELRFGLEFPGPVIPFGAQIEYKPIAAKDIDRLNKIFLQ